MERGVIANGIKPENQQFLSPMLELTQSLQSLSTTRWTRHFWIYCSLLCLRCSLAGHFTCIWNAVEFYLMFFWSHSIILLVFTCASNAY